MPVSGAPVSLPSTSPSVQDQASPIQASDGTSATQTPSQICSPIPPVLSDQYYLGIPSALVLSLIEVYFANVYNASLLLHKASFLRAIAANTVRHHVLLSVCAFASKYLDQNRLY
jgi:hypothetical protein